jgi:hypothetical protein
MIGDGMRELWMHLGVRKSAASQMLRAGGGSDRAERDLGEQMLYMYGRVW